MAANKNWKLIADAPIARRQPLISTIISKILHKDIVDINLLT
jgi:hypothetical protein